MRDLIPQGDGHRLPFFGDDERNPFFSLHREMNRLIDDAFRNFEGRTSFGKSLMASGWPDVEVSETDKEIKVTAEVPGMERNDIEVMLDGAMLRLRGEKRSETEDKDKKFSERFYGRFERHIPLSAEVEEDKINASFKNGVLTVTLPKSAKAQSNVKRIAIKG
jgi:HSP20 family protein